MRLRSTRDGGALTPELRPDPVLQTPNDLSPDPPAEGGTGVGVLREGSDPQQHCLLPREHHWVTSPDEADTQEYSTSRLFFLHKPPSWPFCSPHSQQMALPQTSCGKQRLADALTFHLRIYPLHRLSFLLLPRRKGTCSWLRPARPWSPDPRLHDFIPALSPLFPLSIRHFLQGHSQ